MFSTQMTVFGFSIIFIATTLGATAPFFIKNKGTEKVNVISLGFSAGVMLAASVWSLIIPSIEQSRFIGAIKILPTVIGIIGGGFFMTFIEKICDAKKSLDGNGIAKKTLKLFIAVTVHNIPEGLAVGIVFGAAKISGEYSDYLAAAFFAIGIAVQNLPEGAAVALPFEKAVKSRKKAFLLGVSSGAVEPIFAIIGYFLSAVIVSVQPWLLAFSAGTMIFVSVGDLIPETKGCNLSLIGVWAALAGFLVMMSLDVMLG